MTGRCWSKSYILSWKPWSGFREGLPASPVLPIFMPVMRESIVWMQFA